MNKLIFLSHIHEETSLAQIIQTAIEDEFSGFVEVFVSSDGRTIPAGSNFLKRIENGLINCIGAIYLISPISVKRNWVNFELGAVWIRNSVSQKNNGPEIPAIPICHSGMTLNSLPMPLSNLNAIQGNISSQLEFAFKSLQTAVGGKGKLRTDFIDLASQISRFEKQYTLGENIIKLFSSMGINNTQINQLITECNTLGKGKPFQINLDWRDNILIQQLQSMEKNELNTLIQVSITSGGIQFGPQGVINGGKLSLTILTDVVIDFSAELNKRIK